MQAITTNFQIDYELSTLTPRQLAEQIIRRLEKVFAVDLMSVFEAEWLTERQKILRFKDTLYNGILQRAEAENLSEFFLSAQDFTARAERDYLESEIGVGAKEIDPVPLIALAEKDAEFIKSLRGEDLKCYILTLTKRFENMAKSSTTNQLVAGLIAGGVLSIGASFGEITVAALRQGKPLAAAIRAGIQGIGLRVAISLAAIVLAVLLLFLFLNNPKQVLGMVINQTTEDFIVRAFRQPDGDLYVNAGAIKSFMEDHQEGLGSARIQLKRMLSSGPDDEDHVVSAGLYFIDKKFGVFGAEGLALFSSTTSDLRFAHLFASPYTKDNGTNMAFVPGNDKVDLEKLFDDLYGSRQVRVTADNGHFELAATVNDARGGVVGCIASVTAKA